MLIAVDVKKAVPPPKESNPTYLKSGKDKAAPATPNPTPLIAIAVSLFFIFNKMSLMAFFSGKVVSETIVIFLSLLIF